VCECGFELAADAKAKPTAMKPLDRVSWWWRRVGSYLTGFVASFWALAGGSLAALVVWLKFGDSHRRMVLQGMKVGGISMLAGVLTPVVIAFTVVGIAAVTLSLANWISMPR
jgi:hypothetical protein